MEIEHRHLVLLGVLGDAREGLLDAGKKSVAESCCALVK